MQENGKTYINIKIIPALVVIYFVLFLSLWLIFVTGHPRGGHHRQELQGGEPHHLALRPHHRPELRGQLGLQSPEHRLQRADPQAGLHHQLHHVSVTAVGLLTVEEEEEKKIS